MEIMGLKWYYILRKRRKISFFEVRRNKVPNDAQKKDNPILMGLRYILLWTIVNIVIGTICDCGFQYKLAKLVL